ncbi:hypothetical protein ACFE04_014406 [Oxalis oulophora]
MEMISLLSHQELELKEDAIAVPYTIRQQNAISTRQIRYHLCSAQEQFLLPISSAMQGASSSPARSYLRKYSSLGRSYTTVLSDTGIAQTVFGVMSVSKTFLDFFLGTLVAFSVESVPQEDWSMTISTCHDYSIS